MQLLQGALSNQVIGQLSNQYGIKNQEQTAVAANGIMKVLMSALSRNASTPSGANALVSALDRDHDGSVMDDVLGMLTGTRQRANASSFNGAGILRHVLGGRQNGVIDMIGRMSGLDKSLVGKMALQLAPLALGALGKARNSGGLNVGNLAQKLIQGTQSNAKADPTMGLIGRFLDSDGDGKIFDDIVNIGLRSIG